MSGGGRLSRAGVHRPDEAAQAGHQLLEIDRLGDMVSHAGGQAGLTVGFHRIGGHRNDEARGPARQDALRGLETVDVRHLDVHQDGVEGRLGDEGEMHPLHPAAGQGDDGALAFQQLLGDLLVEAVVLHHEQAHAHQSRLARGVTQRAGRPAPGRLGDGIVQHRCRDRLDQVAAQALDLLLAALGQQLAPVGGDHDDHRCIGFMALANAA